MSARDVLEGWRGTLVVDGYAGYQALFDSGQALEACCWAHARRKFFEPLTANKSLVARVALDTIHELYKLVRKIKHRSADKKAPVATAICQAPDGGLPPVVVVATNANGPNSGLRKTLDYTLKRWPALLRYLDDGRVPIDNNRFS